jgi:hypothetical protein
MDFFEDVKPTPVRQPMNRRDDDSDVDSSQPAPTQNVVSGASPLTRQHVNIPLDQIHVPQLAMLAKVPDTAIHPDLAKARASRAYRRVREQPSPPTFAWSSQPPPPAPSSFISPSFLAAAVARDEGILMAPEVHNAQRSSTSTNVSARALTAPSTASPLSCNSQAQDTVIESVESSFSPTSLAIDADDNAPDGDDTNHQVICATSPEEASALVSQRYAGRVRAAMKRSLAAVEDSTRRIDELESALKTARKEKTLATMQVKAEEAALASAQEQAIFHRQSAADGFVDPEAIEAAMLPIVYPEAAGEHGEPPKYRLRDVAETLQASSELHGASRAFALPFQKWTPLGVTILYFDRRMRLAAAATTGIAPQLVFDEGRMAFESLTQAQQRTRAAERAPPIRCALEVSTETGCNNTRCHYHHERPEMPLWLCAMRLLSEASVRAVSPSAAALVRTSTETALQLKSDGLKRDDVVRFACALASDLTFSEAFLGVDAADPPTTTSTFFATLDQDSPTFKTLRYFAANLSKYGLDRDEFVVALQQQSSDRCVTAVVDALTSSPAQTPEASLQLWHLAFASMRYTSATPELVLALRQRASAHFSDLAILFEGVCAAASEMNHLPIPPGVDVMERATNFVTTVFGVLDVITAQALVAHAQSTAFCFSAHESALAHEPRGASYYLLGELQRQLAVIVGFAALALAKFERNVGVHGNSHTAPLQDGFTARFLRDTIGRPGLLPLLPLALFNLTLFLIEWLLTRELSPCKALAELSDVMLEVKPEFWCDRTVMNVAPQDDVAAAIQTADSLVEWISATRAALAPPAAKVSSSPKSAKPPGLSAAGSGTALERQLQRMESVARSVRLALDMRHGTGTPQTYDFLPLRKSGAAMAVNVDSWRVALHALAVNKDKRLARIASQAGTALAFDPVACLAIASSLRTLDHVVHMRHFVTAFCGIYATEQCGVKTADELANGIIAGRCEGNWAISAEESCAVSILVASALCQGGDLVGAVAVLDSRIPLLADPKVVSIGGALLREWSTLKALLDGTIGHVAAAVQARLEVFGPQNMKPFLYKLDVAGKGAFVTAAHEEVCDLWLRPEQLLPPPMRAPNMLAEVSEVVLRAAHENSCVHPAMMPALARAALRPLGYWRAGIVLP